MLTKRQADVLSSIREHLTEHGISPTIQEVADDIGLSKTAVAEHINALINKGYVKRGDPRKARTLEPVGDELIAKDDAVAAVDRVMEKKKPDDTIGRLGQKLKKVIIDIPSRS